MSQFKSPFEPPQKSQQYQEPHTGYPQWQQPLQQWYPSPSHYYQQQPPPMQPPKRPKKPSLKPIWMTFLIIGVVFIGILAYGKAQGLLGGPGMPHNAGMSEQQYKDSTTYYTVANLDKEGNALSGKDVHFVAAFLNFVKDSNGNTAPANATDPDTFSGIIQIEFPVGTDVSQINVQDKVEVWGTDNGTATGTNAFGATVHEVVISALYMTDRTTGYTAG